jgi:AraC family ethanolamine operon transcriptional activator
MARRVFRDFDEFADSIAGLAGRFVPTARSKSEWWLDVVRPGHLALQQLQIGGATTFAGDGLNGTYTLGLPMTDPRHIRIDGHELQQDSFILLRNEQPFTFTGRDVVRWVGVTLPQMGTMVSPEILDSAHSGEGTRSRTQLPHLDRLRWLLARACSGDDSIDLSTPAAAAAAEQEIAIATSRVLEHSMKIFDRHVGRPQFSRGRVIARTLALIEANEGQPLFVHDLCRATDVSERTLRNIFHEYFGVGPMRLLKVRQLREIRAALLRADPQRDTVTRIAARFGIWDFSLFARNYKALFSESPSRTLRAAAGEMRSRPRQSWMHYASKIFVDDTQRLPTEPVPIPDAPSDAAALGEMHEPAAELRAKD